MILMGIYDCNFEDIIYHALFVYNLRIVLTITGVLFIFTSSERPIILSHIKILVSQFSFLDYIVVICNICFYMT